LRSLFSNCGNFDDTPMAATVCHLLLVPILMQAGNKPGTVAAGDYEKASTIPAHAVSTPWSRATNQLATWITVDLGDAVDARATEHLRLMRTRINRMENLLDGLLSYARAGRVEGHSEKVDTKALVTETFDLCHNHAIKHHDQPAGVIVVTVRPHGKQLEFDVADDGPGIPEDQVERAFGMFQTLRPRDEVEGSGIGLASQKNLSTHLEAH
jgi:signal transduction histidine kinase